VLIAPAGADARLYQAAAESDCALRNAVRGPGQQSISLDPRGNSESILLTSFVVLEWILGVDDNVIRMMLLKLNSESQEPLLRNRVCMASSYCRRTPHRGSTTSHSYRSQTKFPQVDYRAWGYALRAACASCLALYISFSLNLDESHWAFTTCYIVGGQRLQGKILGRSLARIVGTLVGAIASFVLVNAFSQHGVLFITCFAAWLSLCAILSYSRRDDWAYAWVLSGYTTAIVGIPAALAPVSAFEIIASRAENILIGILVHSPVNSYVTNLVLDVGDCADAGKPVLAVVDQESFRVEA